MTNSINKGFQEAYDDLPYRFRYKVQDEIKTRLGISIATFNNKKAGRTGIKKSEKPIIKAVFRKYEIEIEL